MKLVWLRYYSDKYIIGNNEQTANKAPSYMQNDQTNHSTHYVEYISVVTVMHLYSSASFFLSSSIFDIFNIQIKIIKIMFTLIIKKKPSGDLIFDFFCFFFLIPKNSKGSTKV